MKKQISLIITAAMAVQMLVSPAHAEKLKDSQMTAEEYFATFSEYVEGKRKYIPVFPKENDITLDGDVSDWENISEIEAKRVKQYSGEVDAKLHIKYTYDDEKFYLLAVSTDDIWNPAPGTSYWSNDCLQLGFSKLGEKFTSATEYGVSYDLETNQPYLTHPDLTEVAIVRDGDKTIYELAMPWDKLYGEKPDNFLFCIIAGDNDGSGRKCCIELSNGISSGKFNDEFPCMVLVPDKETGFMFVEGTSTGETYTVEDYTVNIYNPGAEQKYNITSEYLGVSEEITVPAKSFVTKVFSHNYLDNIGSQEIDILNDKNLQSFGMSVYVNPTLDFYEKQLNTLNDRIEEIEKLISECESQGIPTDYESVNLTIMKFFAENIPSDIQKKETEHIEYNFQALDEVYNDAKSRLTSYIIGSDTPMYSTRLSADKPIDIVGNTYWGYATTNGVEEYRPVFLQGYGHFEPVANKADLMYGLGANYIVQELGPRYMMKEAGDNPYWSGINSNEAGKREITVQSEVAYSGEKAIKIVNEHPLTPEVYGRIYQNILVRPNTKYKFGCMYKSKNANGMRMTMNDWSSYKELPADTDGWEKLEYEFTTGENQYNTVVAFITESICDECYIDDVYVYAEGSDENLILNSDFELTQEDTGDMVIDYNGTMGSYVRRLENAQKNNIKVGINLSPHYFPTYITTTYEGTSANTPGTIRFRVDHEKTREIVEKHIRAIFDTIEGIECIVDVCLSNEVCYAANSDDYNAPLWEAFLIETYNNDINALNEAYGTEYTSFSEVKMPSKKETTVLNYDYAKFNNTFLTEWHRWMTDIVHELRPDLPVHTKLMSDMQGNHDDRSRVFYNYGYSWEDHAQFFDVIGFDGGSAYKPGEFLVNQFIESSHLTQWFKIDFITSIKNVPWINSETHIDTDNNYDFNLDKADHVGRYMWQEGIHGVGGSAIWAFESTARGTDFQGLFWYQPDSQLAISRSTMDLNRLSHEVRAVSNADRNIGLVYSYSARNYNDILDNNMFNIYSGITFNGLKTKFVSDRQPQDLTHDIDLLFVPNAVHVMPEILDSIIAYQDNGGKVVIFGEDSLTKTERNLPQDAGKIEKIYSRADVIPVTGEGYLVTSPRLSETQDIVDKYIDEMNLRPVVVVNADTGEMVKEIEWEYNVYNGKLLVNVCSYLDYHTKTNINIYVNGKKVDRFKELRSGESYSGTVTIDPSTPLLLQMDIDNPFIDTYGHWAENIISELRHDDIIKGKTEAKFDPQGTLTYAEWITLIVRSLGLETAEAAEGEHWAAPYAEAAEKEGIISGNVDYDKVITREEMCRILVFAVENGQGKALVSGNVTFADSTECDAEIVSKAVNAGLINGYEDNTFRPDGKLTRAEAAKILSNL